MLVAIAVFVFTLILVIWQPKGLGVGWSAALGALIALAAGAVSLHDIPTVWAIVWNATVTFIAVIIISPVSYTHLSTRTTCLTTRSSAGATGR